MKKLLATAVLALGFAMPSNAAITITEINPSETQTDINYFTWNNFKGDFAAQGVDLFFGGASFDFTMDGTLTFEFVGAESGWNNSFGVTGTSTYQETGGTTGLNLPGLFLGTQNVTVGGGEASAWWFQNDQGAGPVGTGNAQFGVFFDSSNYNATSGAYEVNEVYFAFDDNGANNDDDYDDMVIRATFTSAIPEPATWLMMIMGFGMIGMATRRRRKLALS
ncbi:hypothetical protein GCM10017044_09010 [Kordiimonas sediminis]|uniref:Ice-binding protein C-terminal domain-containing protein n=1 Tax=Kordiimonas sediminis TaxID=1735581 RepID=A0A919AN74_9PROT|nr:PEPxxWA-CTERM sorting domain-containing protein [Kordiimonas sediminis]GHF16860.1 hypothetical protein GCM10017044_09010 [Kordiimonas sediminis]